MHCKYQKNVQGQLWQLFLLLFYFLFTFDKKERKTPRIIKLASQNIMLIQINYQQKYSTKNTVIIKKQNKKKYC